MNVEPMEIHNYYFPVNLSQVETLVGKMLTHVEAMGLPEKAEKANKDLVKQSLWQWWSDAQENSMTSYKGCIGPIYSPDGVAVGSSDNHIWFTDIGVIRPTKYSDDVLPKTDNHYAQSENR